jgi:hypothetical protein
MEKLLSAIDRGVDLMRLIIDADGKFEGESSL